MTIECKQCNELFDFTNVSVKEREALQNHYVCSRCKSKGLYDTKNRLVEDDLLPQSDLVTEKLRALGKKLI